MSEADGFEAGVLKTGDPDAEAAGAPKTEPVEAGVEPNTEADGEPPKTLAPPNAEAEVVGVDAPKTLVPPNAGAEVAAPKGEAGGKCRCITKSRGRTRGWGASKDGACSSWLTKGRGSRSSTKDRPCGGGG